MDKQALAVKVGERLSQIDTRVMTLLGIEVVEMTPGRCVAEMEVRDDMVNSHMYCQGGLIFTLADHAFAYACMTENKACVTLSANIIFSNPAVLGDKLKATAAVTHDSGGRTASCGVVVTNQDGTLIAQVQGMSYKTKGQIV
ncbi:MAG: PaaI family thioesterase [Anaerolineae bacterium]